MRNLKVVKDLLVNDLLGELGNEQGRCFAQLKEDAADAKLKMIRIFDVSPGSILINLDKVEQPRTLLRNEKGQRQRCDYVLLTICENRPLMLFVEIKSSTVSKAEIQRQFKGAECMMDYCDAVLNRFHDQDNLLGSFLKRFVVFYKPRIAKRATRSHGPPQKNDIAERAFRYPSPHNPSLKSLVHL